jgi:hypothetical protein
MGKIYTNLIESFGILTEDAPTEFVKTHFHKNNFGFRLPVMLHSDGKFYHMADPPPQMGGPRMGKQIAPWRGDPENRSSLNPASIDGEYVDGKPVDYPEGVTYKTFGQEGQGARPSGTMDTVPTDDQNKTSNYTGQDQKSPDQGTNTDIGIPLPPKSDKPSDSKPPEGGTPFTPPKPEADKPNPPFQRPPPGVIFNEPTNEPEAPSQDPKLNPEELKTKLARFKELLDKSLTREKQGQNPQPAPEPVPPKKKKRPQPQDGYWGQGNSPGNVTIPGSILGPQHTDQAGAGSLGESQKLTIKDFISKLTEIENRSGDLIDENISQAEQQELTKLFLDLSDPQYASNPDVAREIDRYNSVMRDVDKYNTSTFTPGSDQPGMPEVPRQPMPGEKTPPADQKTPPANQKTPPLTGNQFAVMKMQKDLKAAGADLGTYGTNKDGIDGNLGGPNSKTRQAMKKYPEIAKKHGFGAPEGQGAKIDPNAGKTAPSAPMNDKAIVGMLFKSMQGIGTDSTMFMQAIMQIKTPQQFANVSKLYKQVAGEDLMAAIEGDFSGTDLINIQARLNKFMPKKESSELDRIKRLSGI